MFTFLRIYVLNLFEVYSIHVHQCFASPNMWGDGVSVMGGDDFRRLDVAAVSVQCTEMIGALHGGNPWDTGKSSFDREYNYVIIRRFLANCL